MAKITITIQDNSKGGVEIGSTPKFSEMMTLVLGDHSDLTSAHGYAVAALNHLLKLSRSAEKGIIVPTKSEIQKLLSV